MKQEFDYDLIVVGGGGAGLSGSIWAAQAGCKVLIIEADDHVGGSTGLSDGVFNAAGTSLQRKLGFEDSIDEYFDYYMTLNAWRLPSAVVRRFCEEATPTLEWLIELGVNYPEQVAKKPVQPIYATSIETGGLYAAGVEWPPRGHRPPEGGRAYAEVMENRRAVLGVEVALKTRVRELIVEDGAVRGVVVDGQQIRSRAVLLACGGLARAEEALIRTWFPDAYDTLPAGYRPQTVACPNNRGDVVALGQQANADIIGKDCGLAAHSWILPNCPPGDPGRQPKSSIYVNARGQRFAAETAPYAVMPGLIKAQGFKTWGIFDEGARLRSDPSGALISAEWDPQFVLDSVKRGDIIMGDTIEELAGKLGMRPKALRVTIDQWNEDVRAGKDRWFDREMDQIHPIDQGPWYAYRIGLGGFILTGVGPRIDPDCHAYDMDGQIIPGLFAAGEASGGVLGERYVGGGNSVANAITMGRVAGMTIGRELMG